METEKIFKALFENFPSGNNGYKKTDPKSERFYKRKETERKNNRADSDKNQIFFDFIAVFSAMAGTAFVAMAVMVMASATVIMTVVMMVMFVMFVVFVFVTFAGHLLILLHV